MRKPLMAGNWKMNLNHLEAIAVTQKLSYSLEDRDYDAVDIAVIPPFTDIRSVQTLVDGDRLRLTYGAQDLSPEVSGAFTGDISGSMLKKLGCTYVLVGHSERRTIHSESDELVNRKIKAALSNELIPILCIGEELEIREAGTHLQFVIDQLRNCVKGLHKPDLKKSLLLMNLFGQLVPEEQQLLKMLKKFVRVFEKNFRRFLLAKSLMPLAFSMEVPSNLQIL